jgi:Sec-independent protein translocase protein TatA
MFAELLQPAHLLVLGAIAVLFFGGRWFSRLGNGFRDAIRNFRSGIETSKRVE